MGNDRISGDIEIIEPSISRRRIFGGIDVEMAVKMVNEGGSNESRRRYTFKVCLAAGNGLWYTEFAERGCNSFGKQDIWWTFVGEKSCARGSLFTV
nr:hypothetical protein [uncultured Acetatifactor sp.]